MASQASEIVISPGLLDTVSVNITGMPIYTDRAGTTAASFPATVTTATSYYTGIGNVSVTMTSEGVDVTGSTSGTLTVTCTGGSKTVTAVAGDAVDVINTSCSSWRHHIFAGDAASANTNWSTVGQASTHYFAIYRQSSGAQNASISFDIALGAGTWTFQVYGFKDANRGIMTVTIGGVSAGTVDGYNATPLIQLDSLTGIAIPTTGVQTLTVTMATKNASSSSYVGVFNCFALTRTA